MKQINKSSTLQIMVFFTFLHTIAITPFWNKDGMIIPKLIIMFTLSMYLFPIIIINRNLLLSSKIAKIVVIIQCALLIQNLIVLITSSAPLEQQIFGRTGRGLGLITTVSLAIVWIATMLLVEYNQKNHILLGPWGDNVIKKFADRLEDYKTNKKTIQVPVDWKIDAKLLQDIVKSRVKEL
jgi:hypothetical protein